MPQPTDYQLHDIHLGMSYDSFIEAVRANFALLLQAYLQGANVIQFNGQPGAPGANGARGGSMLAIADEDFINACKLPAVAALVKTSTDDSKAETKANPLADIATTKKYIDAIFQVGDDAIRVLFATNAIVHSSADLVQYDTMSFTNGAMLTITWQVIDNQRVYTILVMSIQQSQASIDYDKIVEEVLEKIVIPEGQTLTSQGSVAKSYSIGGTEVTANLPSEVISGTVTNSLLYIAIQMTEAMQSTNSTVLVAGTNTQLAAVYGALNLALSSSLSSRQIQKAKSSMPTGDKQPGMLIIQSAQTGTAPSSENNITDKNLVMPNSRYGLVLIDADSLSIDEDGNVMSTGAQFASFASLSKSVNGVWLMSNCDLDDAIGKLYLSRQKFQLAITGTYKLIAGNVIEQIAGNVSRIVGEQGSTSTVNETIIGNRLTNITGNDTESVSGNKSESVGGTRTSSVTGQNTETRNGHTEVHAGQVTRTYNQNVTETVNNAQFVRTYIQGQQSLAHVVALESYAPIKGNAIQNTETCPQGVKNLNYLHINASGLNNLVMSQDSGARGKYPRCNATTGEIEWLSADNLYKALTGSGSGGSNEPSVIIAERITNDSIYNAGFVTTKTNYSSRTIEEDLTYPDHNIYTCQLDIPPIMGSDGYQIVATSYLKRADSSAVGNEAINIVFTIVSSTGQTYEVDAGSISKAVCTGDTVTGFDRTALSDQIYSALGSHAILCKRLSLVPKRSNDAEFFDIIAVFEDAANGIGDYVYGYRGYDLNDSSRRWRPGAQYICTLRFEPMKAMMASNAGLCFCLNKFNATAVNMGLGQDYVVMKQYALSSTNIRTIFAYMYQNAAYSVAPADMTPAVYVFDDGEHTTTGSDSVSRVTSPGNRVVVNLVSGTTTANCVLAPCLDVNDNINTEVNINTFDLYNSKPLNDSKAVSDVAQYTIFRNPSLFMHCNEGILMMLTSDNTKRLALLPVDTTIYDTRIHDAMELQYSCTELARNNAASDANLAPLFDDTEDILTRHGIFQTLRRITQNSYGMFSAFAISYDGNNNPIAYMVSFKIAFTDDYPTIMFTDVCKVNYPGVYIASYIAPKDDLEYTVVRGVNAFMQYSPAAMVNLQTYLWDTNSGTSQLGVALFLQNQVMCSASSQNYKNTVTDKKDSAEVAKTVADLTTLMPLNMPAMIAAASIRLGTNPIVAIHGTQYMPYTMRAEENAQFDYALNFMLQR
jgi:hypothetical protein